jgi:hypothetical protein
MDRPGAPAYGSSLLTLGPSQRSATAFRASDGYQVVTNAALGVRCVAWLRAIWRVKV